MQETKEHTRIAQRARKGISERAGKLTGDWSRGKGKKSPSALRCNGNDFLNETFSGRPEIPDDSELVSFMQDESRDYLFLCFSNYLFLAGQKFDLEKTGDSKRDINEACNRFSQYLPDGIGLNIDLYQEGGMLFPTLYSFHKAFRDRFVFFPISAIEKMPDDVTDIFCHFVSFFAKSQRIDFPEDHQDFQWVLGDVLEDNMECDPEGYEALIKTSIDYNKGNIRYYLNRIKNTVTVPDVVIQKCSELKPANDTDIKLLAAITKGVELLRTDCIMHYDYNPEYSDDCIGMNYDDCPPVEMQRTWCIVWEATDAVSDYVAETINQEFYNTYCPGFIDSMQLRPDTDKLFIQSDYPERVEEWYDEIFDILSGYGTDK